jgi:hypothetical protein
MCFIFKNVFGGKGLRVVFLFSKNHGALDHNDGKLEMPMVSAPN